MKSLNEFIKSKIFLILFSFLAFSCKKNVNTKAALEINVEVNSDSKPFCELIEENQFIKLETTKSATIGIIKKVEIVDNKIFIQDLKTQSILIFRYPDGKFLSKIQSKGNGPGEYLSIFSFEVIEKEKSVEILDGNLKKLFKYKFNGDFIGYRNIPFHARSFSYNNDNIIFFKNLFSINEDFKYQVIVTNNEIVPLNKYLKVDRVTSIGIAQGNQISKNNNSILFLPINSTYVYEINNEKIKAKYYLNFQNHWDEDIFYLNVDDPRNLADILNKKQIIYGLGVTEIDDFLLLDFWYIKEHYIALYNKNSSQLNFIEKENKGLEYKMYIKGSYNDRFISVKNPTDLLKLINNNKSCMEIAEKQSLNNLKESDNPVLMLTKFKK